MNKFQKFVKLTDRFLVNHTTPFMITLSSQSKMINTQFRMKTSLIGSRIPIDSNPRKNFIPINNPFQINLIQRKRFFNEDTNASSVWDPYPG